MEGAHLHDFYTANPANKSVAMSESRVDGAIASGSVKKMLFLPSGKSLWIVVGKDNEYWADPALGFCTCKDFYFTTLSDGSECYHLKSVKKAAEQNRFVTVEFDDSEYAQFLQALADDSASLLGR
jgi:predicted nucleic acid-binding Zn finger protein